MLSDSDIDSDIDSDGAESVVVRSHRGSYEINIDIKNKNNDIKNKQSAVAVLAKDISSKRLVHINATKKLLNELNALNQELNALNKEFYALNQEFNTAFEAEHNHPSPWHTPPMPSPSGGQRHKKSTTKKIKKRSIRTTHKKSHKPQKEPKKKPKKKPKRKTKANKRLKRTRTRRR